MKAIIILGITLLTIASTLNSFAQYTAYANIYATVIAPLEISAIFDEYAGEILVSQEKATTGNLTVNKITSSGKSLTTNGTALLTTFCVSDQINSTFDITLPSENLTFITENTSILTISNFNSIQSDGGTSHRNSKVITIDATINLPINHIVSNYQAQNQFPITLNYN